MNTMLRMLLLLNCIGMFEFSIIIVNLKQTIIFIMIIIKITNNNIYNDNNKDNNQNDQ